MADQKTVDLVINGNIAQKSLNELYVLSKKLKSEINKLAPDDSKVVQYRKAVKKLEGQIQDTRQNFGLLNKTVKDGAGAADFFGQSLKASLSSNFITAIIQKVYELGQMLFNSAMEVSGLRSELGKLTGATGKELSELTGQVQGISKTFGVEADEVKLAANALAKGFGISFGDALTQIENGFLSGANVSGEFLEQLKEYPVQFKAAGLAAEDAIVIITQSAQQGIFSDKGADVVKEAGLRLREFTKTTEDALAPLGTEINAKIRDAINQNDTFGAIQEVSKGLSNVGLTAKETQTIIADVFGGAGEDAGLDYLKMLGQIQRGTDAAAASTSTYAEDQRKLLESEKALATSQAELASSFEGVGTSLTILLNKTLELTNIGLSALFKSFGDIRAISVGVVAAFMEVSNAVSAFFSLLSEGEFQKAFNQFTNLGASSAAAFSKAYDTEQAAAQKRREDAAKAAADKANKEATAQGQKAGKIVSDNEKAANDAAAKERAKAAEDRKKAEQKEREERIKAEADAQKRITDLQIAAIKDDAERQKAQAAEQLSRDLAELEKSKATEDQKGQIKALLRAKYDQQLRDIQLAQDMAENDKLIADAEDQQKAYEKELADQQAFLDEQNAILEADAAKKADYENQKQAAQEAGFAFAQESFATIIDLLGQDEAARKKNAAAIKAFSSAQVLTNLAQEISGIWKNANTNPINAFIPGAGQAIAAVQTALATARSVAALNQIQSQKFADGGVLSGPSHAQGGIPGRGAFANVEVEGGEFITNKRATANNRALLENINRYGHIIRFAAGGALPSTTPSPTLAAAVATPSGNGMELQAATLSALNRIENALNTYEREKQIVVAYTDIEDAGTKVARVRTE